MRITATGGRKGVIGESSHRIIVKDRGTLVKEEKGEKLIKGNESLESNRGIVREGVGNMREVRGMLELES